LVANFPGSVSTFCGIVANANSWRVTVMQKWLLAVCCVCLPVLGGCALHEVKGEVGGVEVEARTKSGNGDFCPPGQEKKGNC
tara:strand:- start:535 stop:780 length:246 start_codon:yes stop_codon:yes gene_type:complete